MCACVGLDRILGKERKNWAQLNCTDKVLLDLNGSNCGVTYKAFSFK